MPIRRRLPGPLILDRQVVLEPALSPTARLLYVLLHATPDDTGMQQTADLAGVSTVEALRPFVDELAAMGVVSRAIEHGEETLIVN
ncbi:hypothetical protein ACFWW5_10900 [Streptomyces albidoflavus]|nr:MULTISPECIES: hypothetical protein [unclassified Streptomyces]ACX85518.1 pCQ3_17 [Streptomyces sp. W9]